MLAIIEDDMAVLARGKSATRDLEALLMKLAHKPVATLDDIDRMGDAIYDVKASQDVIQKHLVALRSHAPGKEE
jgi:hypothetical protein